MDFKNKILADIEWRTSELASLRTIPFIYNILPNHKEILLKYTIPSIYALWEGFVKNSFRIYILELNKLNLSINETHLNLLTHTLTSIDKLRLENQRMNFQNKKEFIELYQKQIEQPLQIGQEIPTKSNVDFKVINELLIRFNLLELSKDYENKLNKLLKFRNSIAHGENSIPIKIEDITEFSELIYDLMNEIFNKIDDGFNNKTFKKEELS